MFGINKRKVLLVLIDALLINVGYILAIYMRFDFTLPVQYLSLYRHAAIIVTVVNIVTFYYFRFYDRIWRYASINDIINTIFAVTVGTGLSTAALFLLQIHLPRSLYVFSWMFNVIVIGGSRLAYRQMVNMKSYKFSKDGFKKVLIIGAGAAASVLINEMKTHPELKLKPVGALDDDIEKIHRFIQGVSVLGPISELRRFALTKEADEIIIAIPSASKKLIRNVVDECMEIGVQAKTLPGIYELIDGKVSVKMLRDINIEDLLGREPVKVDIKGMSDYLKGQTIMVTGAGGSIGSELCRQISGFDIKRLIMLDYYENNMYDVQNELKFTHPETKLRCVVANIRDEKRLSEVFGTYKPDIVFHAAAHKHVPMMEDNPSEAVKNNILGTLNLVRAADKNNIKKFILISTDKAVNPTSVMGTTKRICEMIVQTYSRFSKTEFAAVRFGNVLGSNGSVIPLFRKQIAMGGPVTVTHPDIKRYFMTIPEAVQLVIQAGAFASGGEIFVLDMGEPVKILDLAKDLIRLSGFEPDVDIPIVFTGLRPGEKMFEELLLSPDKYTMTKNKRIFIEKPEELDTEKLKSQLAWIEKSIYNMTDIQVKEYLKSMVPEYSYNETYGNVSQEIAATINTDA